MSKVALVAVDIRSAHNVGAFFRTCDGFGAELVLVGITPRPNGDAQDDRLPHIINNAHKTISKTALGAEETVKWRYFANFDSAVSVLRADGYKIAALEQDDRSLPISRLGPGKIALVVGTEVAGLQKEVIDNCDEVYEIPMQGHKESFNVSVAAGIALYAASQTNVVK